MKILKIWMKILKIIIVSLNNGNNNNYLYNLENIKIANYLILIKSKYWKSIRLNSSVFLLILK